jgi:hypothetical protein
MSVDDITPGDDKELYRRGLGFLKQARDLRGLPPAAFQRIERRLERPVARPRRRPLLLAAATLAIVLLAGTAFAVGHVGLRRLPLVGPLFTPRVSEPVRPSPSRRVPAWVNPVAVPPNVPAAGGPPSSASAPTPQATSDVPSPPAAANSASADNAPMLLGEARRPLAAQRKVALGRPAPAEPTAPPAETPASAENPILAESQSFSAALARWHRARDARAALAALDAHEQRFPAGHLAVEARLLRAEILLAEGRERESLLLLDRVALAGSPRARELFTVRGELRIKFGRCQDGRADLDEVLAKGMADSFARRAAQTLAHCP